MFVRQVTDYSPAQIMRASQWKLILASLNSLVGLLYLINFSVCEVLVKLYNDYNLL